MPKAHLQFLKMNLTGMVRNETLEGREYLAVPMVMMVEGVLNGSNGPLFYPAEELAKVPQVWNMKPVVVYHPQMDGKALSACDSEIIENYKVGMIMNTSFDGKRLKAEAWLEPDRLTIVDNRIREALDSGEVMEVSTGVFTEDEEVSGEFGGVTYNSIARNYRPDHLALLPDQIGACSVADGAGLMRLNTKIKGDILHALNQLNINADISHDELRNKLYTLIRESISREEFDFWIEEVFDSYFVYSQKDDYFLQDYKLKDDEEVQLLGVPVQVERKIVYNKMPITFNKKKGDSQMNKEEFVADLIAISKWTQEDQEFLLSLNEEQLTKMAVPETNVDANENPNADPNEGGDDPGEGEVVPVVGNAVPLVEKPTANAEPVTAEQYLANAPPEIAAVLNEAMQTQAVKKAELIAVIVANDKNVLTQEQLSAMHVNELSAIAILAAKAPTPEQVLENNFKGMLSAGVGGVVEEPLEMPKINFKSSDADE